MTSTAPRHHPPEDFLLAHAAGQLDAGRRVMIEGHLAFCPSCRESFAQLIAPGRRWLEEQAVVAPKPSLWEEIEARLDRQAEEDPLAGLGAELPLPVAARLEIEAGGRAPRWRPLPLSPARFAVLSTDHRAEAALVIARIPGGRRFPRHLHLGWEDVLVLRGAFRDPAGHFQPGDYQLNAPGTEHEPQVDAGDQCWIVARYEKGIRFRGLRGLIQRLTAR
ncbi:MAG: hypothetical protein D6696_04220 [Acidobacteria bacterium]|nr:MAG: hypothetical protein D6696_04220 [Acidobacteriota bacterium]